MRSTKRPQPYIVDIFLSQVIAFVSDPDGHEIQYHSRTLYVNTNLTDQMPIVYSPVREFNHAGKSSVDTYVSIIICLWSIKLTFLLNRSEMADLWTVELSQFL